MKEQMETSTNGTPKSIILISLSVLKTHLLLHSKPFSHFQKRNAHFVEKNTLYHMITSIQKKQHSGEPSMLK